VIVDSSKLPTYGRLLGSLPEVELDVVQLETRTRDATSFSGPSTGTSAPWWVGDCPAEDPLAPSTPGPRTRTAAAVTTDAWRRRPMAVPDRSSGFQTVGDLPLWPVWYHSVRGGTATRASSMDRFTSLAARMRLSTVPPNRPSSEIRRGLDLSIGHDPTV